MKKILITALLLLLPTFALAQTPAKVSNQDDVNAIDCSGTITAGGTAQSLYVAAAALSQPVNLRANRGMFIMNLDTTEVLCISFTGTAVCGNVGTFVLSVATATTSGGSYSMPLGAGFNTNPSVVAATTGHKFSCTRY